MVGVDIGNTRLHFFWFSKGRIAKILQIPTANVTKNAIKRVLAKFPPEPVIVCSVVPKVNKLFYGLKQKVYFIGSDFRVPIKCRYNQKQVGMDRLVAAFSARKLFPESRIVIDFGTAITIDIVKANRPLRSDSALRTPHSLKASILVASSPLVLASPWTPWRTGPLSCPK